MCKKHISAPRPDFAEAREKGYIPFSMTKKEYKSIPDKKFNVLKNNPGLIKQIEEMGVRAWLKTLS